MKSLKQNVLIRLADESLKDLQCFSSLVSVGNVKLQT